jgi:predicted nucleic acid-binding Zn ribbon protein
LRRLREPLGDPAADDRRRPHDLPRCDANALERLVSQSSFALKGGGWYADGYGQGAKKADDKSKSAETKPAAKADKADKKESKAKSATDVKPSAST